MPGPRGRRPKLTPEQCAAMIERRRSAGVKYDVLAAEFGVSYALAVRICTPAVGPSKRGPASRIPESVRPTLAAALEAGTSAIELGRRYNVSRTAIYKAIKVAKEPPCSPS